MTARKARNMAGTESKTETVPIRNDSDVVFVRQRVRTWALEMKFSLVDQTKIVTAASELARNTLEHGRGGELELAIVENGIRRGIQLRFSDRGPGIADIKQALTDGFTTGQGMGLGLGGSKRLMNEFDIVSSPGGGTVVTVIRWK
jgi:serine/threonine-protein kinase RsbT